jgi:hypothetical protein
MGGEGRAEHLGSARPRGGCGREKRQELLAGAAGDAMDTRRLEGFGEAHRG